MDVKKYVADNTINCFEYACMQEDFVYAYQIVKAQDSSDINNVIAGKSFLLIACQYGRIELVKLLLDKGADINTSDMIGNTPLIIACRENNLSIVALLLRYGAKANVKNILGETPILIAAINGYIEIVNCIVDFYCAEQNDLLARVITAVKLNNV